MDTGKKKYFVVEWTIKNFSCWNGELHDKVITSTKTCTVNEYWIELYPRGLSGEDEHLVVLLHRSKPWKFPGDLSFISSDGSVLCTQQVDSKNNVSLLKLLPGPKFEEVVAEIRKKETLNKDRLTIQWRMINAFEMVDYMCTEITAFDVNFKTTSIILDYINTHKILSCLKCPHDEENMDVLLLEYKEDRSDRSKILLTLQPFSHKKNVSVLTRMTVLNNDDVVRTEDNEHLFRDRNTWVFCNSLTRGELLKGVSLNLYLKILPSRKYNYSLNINQKFPMNVDVMPTISFKLPGTRISEERSLSSGTTDKTNNSLTALSSELMCLYQDQDFTDFQLKCGNVTFPVHKNILSARSPVFKTMLSTDMREAASGCMDITDIDPSTLGLFLTYLYTGGVEKLQGESALKLYYPADKYQVPSLKSECVSVLCSSVFISNVCDILSLANRHQDDKLIGVTHEFILNNYDDILESEEWKIFMRVDPLLAVETLTHISVRKKSKK